MEAPMRNVIRQGDVNFVPGKQIRGIKQVHQGRYVVARGEATGSVHELIAERPEDFEVFLDGETLFLKVLEPIKIRHSHDHEPVVFAPGEYVQNPEREMDHFAKSMKEWTSDIMAKAMRPLREEA
jgi:hypothetical protein